MKNLKHGDLVFGAPWGRSPAFSVGTVFGYYAEDRKNGPNEIMAGADRAAANGHETVWSVRDPTCLCADPGHYDRQRAREATAVEVGDGEVVLVEGRFFTVRLIGRDFCDGIKFIPAEEP